MLIKRMLLMVMITVFLSSCSYNAKVSSSSAPVKMIQKDKHIDCSISYYFERDLNSLNSTISPVGYVCKTVSYPINAKEAFENSLKEVLESSFTNVEKASGRNFSSTANEYNFVFELVSFDPSIDLTMYNTLTQILFPYYATINAESKIAMKVRALNKHGAQILDKTVYGEGSENGNGQCSDGANYLAKATENAIEVLLEDFVYKIINSGDLTAKK